MFINIRGLLYSYTNSIRVLFIILREKYHKITLLLLIFAGSKSLFERRESSPCESYPCKRVKALLYKRIGLGDTINR